MLKEKQPKGRREALVLGAYNAIAQKGFEGLRLREVADSAGIDHSTLHHYFPTKQDLITAVLDYATDQFRPRPVSGGPAFTSLWDHLEFLGSMIAEHPDLHLVLREFDLRSFRDKAIRSVIADRESGWRERLGVRIKEAAEQGLWPSAVDPATGAELIIALVKGASLKPEVGPAVLSLLRQLSGGPQPPRKRKK